MKLRRTLKVLPSGQIKKSRYNSIVPVFMHIAGRYTHITPLRKPKAKYGGNQTQKSFQLGRRV